MASNDTPQTAGQQSESEPVFHVVCRDCRHESVEDTRTTAETVVETHADETGHCVAYRRIE